MRRTSGGRWAAWAVGAAIAVAPAAGQETPPPAISVSAVAEVRVPSDRARLDFMVETQARTARAAAQQNAELMERVVRALREAGGQSATVETSGYGLEPVYTRPDRNEVPTVEAYRAVNHVLVRADDVTRVGPLVDAAIAAGANRINGLSFEARDPQPARLEAVRAAVSKARAEAEAAAEALGATLGEPLDVNVGMDYAAPPMPFMRDAMSVEMAVSATPIEPGQQVVRANVSIRYRIAP